QSPSVESKKGKEVAVHRFDRTIRVDELNALVFGCQFKVTVPNAIIKFELFRFEAAFIFDSTVIPRTRASQSDFRLDVEQKSQIGPIRIADQIGKLADEIQGNTPAITLISHRCVIIAVADYHFVSLQSRLDLFL